MDMRKNFFFKFFKARFSRCREQKSSQKKSFFFIKCFLPLVFCLSSPGLRGARNMSLETLPLYVGVQYDYQLSSDLKGKKLKFEGSYKRYTGLKYNSKTGIIRFIPRRVGVSALNIKGLKGKILKKLTLKVSKTDLQQAATEIQSLLRAVDGIQVKILNNKVVVDGEILVPRDMRRIHDVVREYRGKATSLVTLSPLAQSKVAKFIEKEINDPNITVRATNMVFILEGFVSKPAEKKRAFEIAQLYLPDHVVDRAISENKVKEWKRTPVLNYIQVREKKADTRPKLIQLIVHYVELNKDYADSFRFQWTPQIDDTPTKFTFHTGSAGLGAIGGVLAGTINNFLPKLNWAKSFGFARILHSANVITEAGQQATIASKKLTPFQGSTGQNGEQTVEMAETGIQMQLTPNVAGLRGDSVRLANVGFTVSNMVGSAGGKPITTSRKLTTSIHVQSGLSAVMGGIISNKTFSDYNREPPQGSSRPLFSFLASKKFHRSQSQFIVFVTPIIKTSASSGVRRIKKKFKLSGR